MGIRCPRQPARLSCRPALAVAAREIVTKEQAHINVTIGELTGGTITSPNQVARIRNYLQLHGIELKNLGKSSVAAALAKAPAEDVKHLLELRRDGGRTSARKLDTLLAGLDADDRLRGTLRFTAPAPADGLAPVPTAKLEKAEKENLEPPSRQFSPRPGACPRAGRSAGHGRRRLENHDMCSTRHVLIGADFSAIKSRVLAWLSANSGRWTPMRDSIAPATPRWSRTAWPRRGY